MSTAFNRIDISNRMSQFFGTEGDGTRRKNIVMKEQTLNTTLWGLLLLAIYYYYYHHRHHHHIHYIAHLEFRPKICINLSTNCWLTKHFVPVTANSFSKLHVRQLSTALPRRRNRDSADVTCTVALSRYKSIIKPIWTYGIEIWGCASKASQAILQKAQSSILRMKTDAPWYVTKLTLHDDLKIPFVRDVITDRYAKHRWKLVTHPNATLQQLLDANQSRRLNRTRPSDLL